jgi:hypothetical protein
MPAKKPLEPDDPVQTKRFLETAEKVGADADDEALERALRKIAKRETPKPIRRP